MSADHSNNGKAIPLPTVQTPDQVLFEHNVENITDQLRLCTTDFIVLVANNNFGAQLAIVHGKPKTAALMMAKALEDEGLRHVVLDAINIKLSNQI